MQLTFVAKTVQTTRITEFLFRGTGDLPSWNPGAHVDVTIGDLTRSYSLMPSQRDTYRVAVLLEENSTGGSRAMHGLSVGDVVGVSPPRNNFALADEDAPSLFIAGGIGITPMPAMMQRVRGHLFYCGQSRDQMAFLCMLEKECGNGLTVHCDDQSGLPDFAAVIAQHKHSHLYICGPRPMIDAARKAAEGHGIPDTHIHIELFSVADALAGDQPFDVVIHDTGVTHTIPPGKTIIDVLEDAGMDLMYDCQRGDCGICQTDVIEGVPDHRDVVLSQAEKDAGNVMQICVSRAKSKRLVLDL